MNQIAFKQDQLNFVIFSPAFQAHVGGIIALYNLACIIDEAGFVCKIFDMNGLNLPNSIFAKYATETDINENTVVVYPEIIFGNPLNANYVVRWILCKLGVHCPHDIYTTWSNNDFVYHYGTYNPEKDLKKYNILSPLYLNPALKNHGKSRDGYCHIIRKGNNFHKPLKYIHPQDSLFLNDNLSQEILIDIFNKKEYLISYDPYSYINFMAALCGCIPVVVPIANATKTSWLKSSTVSIILEKYGENELKGIAYGLEEVEYARSTLQESRYQQELFIQYGKETVHRFINDMVNIVCSDTEISYRNDQVLKVIDIFPTSTDRIIVKEIQEQLQNNSETSNCEPLVSICIPTYNGEMFIHTALQSIKAQTYNNIEIIISDDASSDKTLGKINNFQSNIKNNINLFTHERYGLANNWNFCIYQAKGKYIKFLFQDDILEPDAISKMVALAEEDEEIGLVFSPRKLFSNSQEVNYSQRYLEHHEAKNIHKHWSNLKTIQSGEDLLQDPNIFDNPINKIGEPSTVLIRREVFDRVGLFNTELCQLVDLEMWLRIMSKYKIGFIDQVLSHFRIHPQQQTRRNIALKDAILLDYQKLFQYIADDSRYPDITRQMAAVRYAILSNDHTELNRLRKQTAEQWLSIPDEKLAEMYGGLLGKTHQMLLSSNINDRNFDNRTFFNEIIISQKSQPSKAVQHLLVAMLSGDFNQLLSNFSQIPKWLLCDYLEFLLSSRGYFEILGNSQRYYEYMKKCIHLLHEYIFKELDTFSSHDVLDYFTQSAFFINIYFNENNLKEIYVKRAEIIEYCLKLNGHEIDYEFADRPTNRKKIRLGILAADFTPSAETFAYLPVYEYISRDFEVILYSLTARGHRLEQYCQLSANLFKVLPQQLSAQVDIIRNDDLDILFIATNVTVVTNQICLLAIHRLARIQVTSGGSVVTTGIRNMDYYISGTLTDPSPTAQEHYQEKLIKLEGTAHCFSYGTEEGKSRTPVERNSLGIAEDAVVFISGANYFKMIPELLESWAKIIARVPNSVLLLLPFGPNWSKNYQKTEFINHLNSIFSKHGLATEHLIVLDPQPVPDREDMKEYYKIADVYLDSYPFAGTTSLIEPLQVNLPVIARQGNCFRSAMGAAIIQTLNIPDLVADSEESYIGLAVALGNNSSLRQQKSSQIKERMQNNPSFLDSRSYAAKIGSLFQELFSDYIADTLSQNLRLKDINLIIFPDWSESEELISSELEQVIKTVATHPDSEKITLLINIDNISVDDVEMLLSAVAMNLLMQEDLDVTEGLEISLVESLSDIQWQALLPCIHARIVLEHENQDAVIEAKAEKLISCELADFSQVREEEFFVPESKII
ncbi:glycosyltransferase [Anabaena sp. CCY 9910]|uniref:O-linked N-acetylglucosamine transferase family protein n=1 Tax=Anabaena sp. CCY 9910 TaxID=3103870 RepID=UPI0039DF9756